MARYTFAIQCKDKARNDVYVFCKDFTTDGQAIEYASAEIQEPVNKVAFILIRRGDAGPKTPVFWDSREDKLIIKKSPMRLKIDELYARNEFDTLCYEELLSVCP